MIGAGSGQAKGAAEEPLGLYVHVPFCASTCDFCAFYQVEPTAAAIQGFLAGLEAEAALVDWPRPVTTVFFGGGTPGLLKPGDLERLIGIIRTRTGGAPREWTIELAPGSVTADRLGILRAGGVNRVSLGVQSFQPDRLEALGRQHTREQILRAHDRIRAAGCDNVNLDLMFALPGQTEAEWAADVDAAVALAPQHLSAYCLTFEEDTAMWIKLSQGRVKLDPEKEARFYEAGWGRLADAGYAQYEISNFSRPGFECRHNRNTWRMNEWIGLGPAAASQHGGRRGANVADLERWRANLARGERMTEDRIEVTPALLVEDALIFGLRMNEGVDVARWRGRCPAAPWAEIDARIAALVAEGLAWRDGGRIGTTARGRLLADAVGGEFFGVSNPV